MKSRLIAFSLISVVLLNAQSIAQEDPQQTTPKPTENHKVLEEDIGVWDTSMNVYLKGPNEPPQLFKGKETNKLVNDGLWLLTEYESDFVGKPYKGCGLLGYDVRKKKYVGTWVDNYGTGLGEIEGDYDPQTRTMINMLKRTDEASGKQMTEKHVTVYDKDGDSKVFTIYFQLPDTNNPWVKIMDLTAKKRK